MNPIKGLKQNDVHQKLKSIGFNELPLDSGRKPLKIFFEIIKEPTSLLLVIASVIYLLIGNVSDGFFLLALVCFMLGISFYQEYKAEKTLQSFRDLSSPRALVIREEKELRIPARELVPDDIIVLHEGDRVPADAILIQSSYLRTDESTLTGESVPVPKNTSDKSELFLGTLVIAGHGVARVTKTGKLTELGKLGKSLREITDSRTALEIKMTAAVKKISIAGSFLSIFVVISYGIVFKDWFQGALLGIASAISLLPAEFPIVLAIFLSIGAWRISKNRVLVRRLPSLEALGSVTRLCIDKTGTLTFNQMKIQSLDTGSEIFDLTSGKKPSETFHSLIEYAALASRVDPFDPMDKAIWNSLLSLREPEHIHRDWTLVQEYPLSNELRAMSCVWRSAQLSEYIVASKGAPETIIDLCHLNSSDRKRLLERVQILAARGLRILGVAQAKFSNKPLPTTQQSFHFQWVGLIGMEDPLRPEAKFALQECRSAGVGVSMITGDYPETARNIAMQIGLDNSEIVTTGNDLEQMPEKKLTETIGNLRVFARITPHQKLKIVSSLQAAGNVVGMTGDGVNDAPALRKADIGIAMGARGTDVAREAADIVLLDDNFSSIINAIRGGRRIYENIQKAVIYLLTVHVPIASLTIVPVLFKMPLLLFPVHIVILEMIIDPTCTLAYEAEDESIDLMKRGPRQISAPLFTTREFVRASLSGFIGFLSTFFVYLFYLESNYSVDLARTMAFTTLIFWNLGAILIHRSTKTDWSKIFSLKNKVLNIIAVTIITSQILVINIQVAAALFHFVQISIEQWVLCFSLGVIATLLSLWIHIFGSKRASVDTALYQTSPSHI
jgi:Ca2+-transporting ATPase